MENSNSPLSLQIEQERRDLEQCALQYGLLDTRTIQKSQQLDQLLNEYNRHNWKSHY